MSIRYGTLSNLVTGYVTSQTYTDLVLFSEIKSNKRGMPAIAVINGIIC